MEKLKYLGAYVISFLVNWGCFWLSQWAGIWAYWGIPNLTGKQMAGIIFIIMAIAWRPAPKGGYDLS